VGALWQRIIEWIVANHIDSALTVGGVLAAPFALAIRLRSARPRLRPRGNGSGHAGPFGTRDLILSSIRIANSDRRYGYRLRPREAAEIELAELYDCQERRVIWSALRWEPTNQPNTTPLFGRIRLESGESGNLLLFAKYRGDDVYFVYSSPNLATAPSLTISFSGLRRAFEARLTDTRGSRWKFKFYVSNYQGDLGIEEETTFRKKFFRWLKLHAQQD